MARREDRSHPTPPLRWTGGVDQFLTYKLAQLLNMLSKDGQQRFQAGAGLHLAQWRVVAVLATHGPSTAAEVGRLLVMERAQVSRIQATLVRSGLIARTPPAGQPASARRALLTLTASGWATFEAGWPIAQARQAELREVLGESDHAAFIDAVDRLTTHFTQKTAHKTKTQR